MNIAVIGVSGVYPGARDLDQLHKNLAEGVDSIRTVPESRKELLGLDPQLGYQEIGFLDDIEYFDHGFFNIAPKEADNMSPEQRLALEMAVQAVLDAGYSMQGFRGSNCGVFVAAQDNDYYSMLAEKSGLAWIGSLKSMLAGKISYHLDLHGPNMVIDTGCSSGLVCIDDACRRLERGEIDYALVGGVTIYLKFGTKNTDGDLLGIEAGDGRCKPFDAAADGIGVGEGGGFFLLKRLEEAEQDLDHIYGVIRASAINGDGARCNSMTTPSIEGQKEAILRAWRKNGIHPEEVTEIEAHGTGTKLGDPIEVESFTESCGEYGMTAKNQPIYLGSIKGNIGHLNATAAIASVTKILLGFQHNVIYPLCHYASPNPLIDFESSPLRPANRAIEVEPCTRRLVGANSFGLSGTNAHIVLENYISAAGKAHKNVGEKEMMLKVSARSTASFQRYVKELEHYLLDHELTEELIDTLNTGRDDYHCRKIVIGKSKEELVDQLKTVQPAEAREGRKTVFVIMKISHPEGIALCKNKTDSGTIEWMIYDYVKSLGIEGDMLIADANGQKIVEYTGAEDWNALGEFNGGETALSEEEIINKLDSMCEQDQLDVVWIGDYKGGLACGASIYCMWSQGDLFRLIQRHYENGKTVNWGCLYGERLQKVPAPTYCFDGSRHWGSMAEPQVSEAPRVRGKEAVRPHRVEDIAGTLKQIWIDVLEAGEDEVQDDTDFFDLGGNSLLITLLVEEVENVFAVKLLVEEIYDYYTIVQQKEIIEERLAGTAGAEQVRAYELLPMQRLILNSIRRHPDKSDWNLTLTFKIDGPLEFERMRRAYAQACGNHDLLSSRLVSKAGRDYLQKSETGGKELEVIVMDAPNPEEAVHAALKRESLTPMDVGGDYLAEMKIYQISDQTSYLLFKISHLIADGWSLNIIFDELCHFYASDAPREPELKTFLDYALYEKEYLESDAGLEQVKHWKHVVDGTQRLTAPRYEGVNSIVDLEYILINMTMLNKMRAFSRREKTSLFQIVLTLYHMTVQDFLKTKKSSIGVMVGNRNNMDYGNTVGLFARSLLSTAEAEEGEAPGLKLQRVKKQTNQMLEQQMCSLGSAIVEGEREAFEDFVEFLLTYQNFKNSDMVIDGLKFSPHMISETEAICPMTILFYDSPQAMLGSVQYDPIYFSRQDVKEFIRYFHKNVQLLIEEGQ